jgi:hypothetical protein
VFVKGSRGEHRSVYWRSGVGLTTLADVDLELRDPSAVGFQNSAVGVDLRF